MLKRREPRERDKAYLGWVAGLPCVASMALHGQYVRGVHVCHLRMGSPEYGKRPTGMQEKPSDQWTTPLAPHFHTGDIRKTRIAQHEMSEEDFWARLGINPFELCIALRKAYVAGQPGGPVIALFAARARKAKDEVND